MIYTKAKLKDGTTVCAPVTAKSTYTRCAMCGKEISMDIREIVLAGAQDPFDTEANCAECTAKMMHWSNINLDTVARLVSALKDMGYEAEIQELFDDFEVEDAHEFIPEECELFVDELFDKIAEVRHEE